jgi:hypothetical protein
MWTKIRSLSPREWRVANIAENRHLCGELRSTVLTVVDAEMDQVSPAQWSSLREYIVRGIVT